ncbi:magnesium transporter CorA family protein [Pseudohoeflea suaedae]|nr:magnesium transporter CorA family protein [Pseudohoeflea suaedae]
MLFIYDKTGAAIDLPGDGQLHRIADIGWYDLFNPTDEESAAVEAATGIDLPSRDELSDIEPSSRLYIENDALFLTASLVYRVDSQIAGLADTGFILSRDSLITVRHAEPRAFKIFTTNMRRTCDFKGGGDILASLLETIVDRTAEVLENASRAVDDMTTSVFLVETQNRPDRATRDLEAQLVEIAALQRLVAKARESLNSLSRVTAYMASQPQFASVRANKEKCKSVNRDIKSLSEHAGFIAGNITFLLDACLGLISVQQNNVMKIFSVMAVLIMPATLIGSIYGMNFARIPELHWAYGYPMALGAMLLSGIVPYLWFRRKGWW